MDERIAQDTRHPPIDFSDHDFRGLRGGLGASNFDAERTKAVFIRRRHLNQCDIYRQSAVAKQARNFGKKDRHEIRVPGLHCRAHILADEESAMPETCRVFRRDVRRRSERERVDDLNIAQFMCARNERAQQAMRHTRAAAHINTLVGLNDSNGFFSGNWFGTVHSW